MSQEFEEAFFAPVRARKKGVLPAPLPRMNQSRFTSPFTGMVGLELEMEAENVLPTNREVSKITGKFSGASWTAKEDGSLRGYSMEYVLTQPCNEEEIPFFINELFNVINTKNTRLNNSNRCSTHVHINMSGKKLGEVTSNIILWAVFERRLIAWNGIRRKTNHFALSTEDSQDSIDAWRDFLRSGRPPRGGGLKYSAQNLLPLFSYGSLEYRVGEAADEPTKPIRWATFLVAFSKYVEENYRNPRDIARDLSERGGYAIFRSISEEMCNEICGTSWDEREEFDKECIVSFRRVQQLALEFPWNEWREEEDKPYTPNPFQPT